MERNDSGRTSLRGRAGEDDGRGTDGRLGLRGRLRRVFSLRAFLLALVASLAGLVAGGLVPVVGSLPLVGLVGRYVGLFVVAFALGLWFEHRRYVEVALGGATAAALGFVVSVVFSTFLPVGVRLLSEYGTTVAGVGAGAGCLVAVAGYYFGRDLRAGLTREVP